MKRSFVIPLLAVSAVTAFGYQVTGPIVEVTPSKIVVKKGNEKWEVQRSAETKLKGEPKVGAKATIEYKMLASEIVVKDEPAKTSGKKATKGKRDAE